MATGTLAENTTAKTAFNNDKPEDPKPTEPKPTNPPKPENPKKPTRFGGFLPRTGDFSNIELWLGVAGISLLGQIAVFVVWKKKKHK